MADLQGRRTLDGRCLRPLVAVRRLRRLFALPGGLPLASPPRTALVDLANYEDIELFSLLGRLDYRLRENATVGFSYRYEDYTIDSFILEGLRLPGALLLNADNGDYRANLFVLDLTLAF